VNISESPRVPSLANHNGEQFRVTRGRRRVSMYVQSQERERTMKKLTILLFTVALDPPKT
jgi:hypothetical protein